MRAGRPGEVRLLYRAGRTVLDPATHRYYRRLRDGDVGLEERLRGRLLNRSASVWCATLPLSQLLEGEAAPPVGQVGQYGWYGCVLEAWCVHRADAAWDVVLVPYRGEGLGRFLAELTAATGTRFEVADVDPRAVRAELHLLASVDPWATGDASARQAEVRAALAWGRAHAERLSRSMGRG